MADTIRKCGADIIGLQEMYNLGETEEFTTQTKVLAEKLGFHQIALISERSQEKLLAIKEENAIYCIQ